LSREARIALAPQSFTTKRQVVGEYESPAGFLGLLGDIWSDFLNLDLGAWLLILSPYVTIQLARIAFKLMQGRTNVTQVTDSREFS
jgi:hypothetical protein